jgi:hypothetical protein
MSAIGTTLNFGNFEQWDQHDWMKFVEINQKEYELLKAENNLSTGGCDLAMRLQNLGEKHSEYPKKMTQRAIKFLNKIGRSLQKNYSAEADKEKIKNIKQQYGKIINSPEYKEFCGTLFRNAGKKHQEHLVKVGIFGGLKIYNSIPSYFSAEIGVDTEPRPKAIVNAELPFPIMKLIYDKDDRHEGIVINSQEGSPIVLERNNSYTSIWSQRLDRINEVYTTDRGIHMSRGTGTPNDLIFFGSGIVDGLKRFRYKDFVNHALFFRLAEAVKPLLHPVATREMLTSLGLGFAKDIVSEYLNYYPLTPEARDEERTRETLTTLGLGGKEIDIVSSYAHEPAEEEMRTVKKEVLRAISDLKSIEPFNVWTEEQGKLEEVSALVSSFLGDTYVKDKSDIQQQ